MFSICLITKNEEKNIKHCLESFKDADCELVVVDTGSTDNTKAVAHLYTEKVYDFPWCDDFSAAKNFAVEKSSFPYVMIIDSDEILEFADWKKLDESFALYPDRVGRICRKNILGQKGAEGENQEWINRIYAKEKFCFKGKIHEQIVSANEKPYKTYQAPIVIRHVGYMLSEEERKQKAKRNIALLQQELERLEDANVKKSLPEEQIQEELPYVLYQLGKSYYMAGDYKAACDYFVRGTSFDLNPKLEYVIDMVETYGYALLNSNQAEDALSFENIYEEFGSSADFQFLMGLIYMNNERFADAVGEFQKAVKQSACKCAGANSYLAYYNMGVIFECLGETENAADCYQKSGDYIPAKKRLQLLNQS